MKPWAWSRGIAVKPWPGWPDRHQGRARRPTTSSSTVRHPIWRCCSSRRRLTRASSTSASDNGGSTVAGDAYSRPMPALVATSATATVRARRRHFSPVASTPRRSPPLQSNRACASSPGPVVPPHGGGPLLLQRGPALLHCGPACWELERCRIPPWPSQTPPEAGADMCLPHILSGWLPCCIYRASFCSS